MRSRKFGKVVQIARVIFDRRATIRAFSKTIAVLKFSGGKRDILRACVIQQRSTE